METREQNSANVFLVTKDYWASFHDTDISDKIYVVSQKLSTEL